METLQPCFEINDALLVDDLLDFSCGDIGGLSEEGDDCEASVCGQHNDSSSVQVSSTTSILARPSTSCAQEASESLYSPPEELAGELEWLSTFMEDSYKGADQSIPLTSSEQWFSKSSSRKDHGCLIASESPTWARAATTSWLRMSKGDKFCQFLDVGSSPLIELSPRDSKKNYGWDKRGRSKRSSRSGGRVWSLQTVMASKRPASGGDYHSEGEEEEEAEHSQASSLDYEPFSYHEAEQPARKKAKKERGGANEAEGRRCSHCQVQKTPQWRAGPLGPKTLCNACGVRYKSGRLLPEYRPAASPTFVTELHSNSHKKVLEMRTSKCRFGPQYHILGGSPSTNVIMSGQEINIWQTGLRP